MAQQQQGYLVSREFLLGDEDGEQINLYISISPVKIGYGRDYEEGYIMLLRDITREKSLEEERDEFISVVSHELRTPITIAEGNISNALLVAGKVEMPQAVSESLDAAHKQVIFLSDMINDLSTLSRAERGKLQSAPEDIDIHDLIKSLQRDYRSSAQQKNLQLFTHVDKEVSSLFSSRLYVREILQNFLTNAIKYTQEGEVKLEVSQQGSRVAFKVTDSGIGISKTDQKHLFKKFFRSEDYRTRENNGTGLGLYVTLKLAKLIHAQIKVESELNKGSCFTIIIPPMKRKNIPEIE
jgi:signal transduction histidine kinase